ncbi:ABC transporter permease [candidate division KSB1 bacterium]
MKKYIKPPKILKWLLRYSADSTSKLSIAGDIDEEFAEITASKGKFIARLWYLRQTIILLALFVLNSIYWSFSLFKNYLKIAFRNIKRQKGYSFINIFGLTAGISCSMLITFYVLDELSYDNYHLNSERVYRLVHYIKDGKGEVGSAMSAPTWAPALKDQFDEIEHYVRLKIPSSKIILSRENKSFALEGFAWADEDYFSLLTVPFLFGDPATALKEPFSVVINEQTARLFFGSENPVGKTLVYEHQGNLKVTGVIKDRKNNTHLDLNIIGSFRTLEKAGNESLYDWFEIEYYSYLLLKENCSVTDLESKFPAFLDENMGSKISENGVTLDLKLQPIQSIHLHSKLEYEIGINGNMELIYSFSVSAVLILIIACFNFINLSTARSGNRGKEVGIRKIAGANRSQLIRQFLGESCLLTFVAFCAAVLIVVSVLPWFNNFTGKDFVLNSKESIKYVVLVLILSVLLGLFSGSYPAFFLSSFRVSQIIKDQFKSGRTGYKIRRLLVILQFSITGILLTCTIEVHNQHKYLKNRDPGFTKNHLIILPLISSKVRNDADKIKAEFLQNSRITSIGSAASVPGGISDDKKLVRPLDTEAGATHIMQRMKVDYDLISTLGLEIIAGRNFSKDFRTDIRNSFVVNLSAVKKLGYRNPEEAVGRQIQVGGSRTGNIIGVVKDFHMKSMKYNIEPMVFYMDKGKYLIAQISPEYIQQTLEYMKEKWEFILPGYPFEYYFLDKNLEELYNSEEKSGKLFRYFSALAILISCLGLFGLVIFTTEQRRKEIGIRKVVGASFGSIISLTTKELLLLVTVSNLFVFPISYYFLKKWLQSYAYHIDLNLFRFLFSTILLFMITLLTVSYQSFKAASANPVDSLRNE